MQGATWGEDKRSGSTRGVGSCESVSPQGKWLYWGSGQNTQGKGMTVTRLQSGEDKKENQWQASVSHWCTWSPGQGALSLFMGDVEADRKCEVLKIYLAVTYYYMQ